MNVLVTGATGFLGRRLAFKLAEKGYIIHALYRSEEKASQLKHNNIKLFKGDITVSQSIGQAVRSCKQVYHLAAFAKVWEKNKDRVYQLNVQGTLNTIHAAFDSGVEKIVFISTAGVFGPCSGKEVSERTEYPDDFFTEYERTKCQAEKEVLNLVKNGKNIVIVNPTRIYGPGLLRESNSLTKIVKLYLEGKWHVIPGNGKSIGNYVYIDDVVNGMISAMENGKTGERYILGGVNVSYNELFSTLKDVSGKKNFIIKIPFFVIHTLAHLMMLFSKLSGKPPVISPQLVKKFNRNWAVSSSKAVNELGYKITPLREGLSQTIAWLKSLKV
ncbi:MAG: SDR family oxidoreductase [Candidatus Aminicenantaceae bacterium]